MLENDPNNILNELSKSTPKTITWDIQTKLKQGDVNPDAPTFYDTEHDKKNMQKLKDRFTQMESQEGAFKSIYKKFWKSYLLNQPSDIFPDEILDAFFNNKATNLIIQKSFKKIDEDIIILDQLNKNVGEHEVIKEKDVIKYLIKKETIIGKKFWKDVVSKIQNEAHRFAITAKEQKIPFNSELLHSKLTILENSFLNTLADLYLKNKKDLKK